MPQTARPGDVLADRYRLLDLLSESRGGRFWRAHDRVLERHVALHVIDAEDERASGLIEAARRSATVLDRRVLRVLDAERLEGICYVVNEWGSGVSLDILLATAGPLSPRKAAWLVAEVSDSVATAHAAGVPHGRLVPENVLVERSGHVKVIGLCVDAALHGLPGDSPATDVADLAGLLYAALTGRWAGASLSSVPPAPQEHGHVLRPRQVRAGVPRPLDVLCERVLNPYAGRGREEQDLSTARGIATYLEQFVGDPTGMPEAMAVGTPSVHQPRPIVLPSVPEVLPHDAPSEGPSTGSAPDDPSSDSPEEPEATQRVPVPESSGPAPASVELPTEAGLPIFDDDGDDVSWLERRTKPVPPPPPFEEPPARPLFAPDPEDGRPARRPRPGVAHTDAGPHAGGPGVSAGAASYWPWDTGRGTDSGLVALGEDPAWEEATGNLDAVPGRRWMRLAIVIALCVLLLLAAVVAVNLGRGRTPLGAEPDPSPGESPQRTEAPTTVTGVTATDFDPQGETPEENPELAPLAVDGDATTAWRTLTYEQQLGPAGLKTGLGLVLDLGSEQEVADVALTMVGAPTGVTVYVSDTVPTGIGDLTAAASGTVEEQGRLELDEPTSGRYVVIWLTALPATSGGFRGEVAEVVVRG